MAKSLFSAPKNERVFRTAYPTKQRARHDLIAYIEGFYNTRHSAHGDRRLAIDDRTKFTAVTSSQPWHRRKIQ